MGELVLTVGEALGETVGGALEGTAVLGDEVMLGVERFCIILILLFLKILPNFQLCLFPLELLLLCDLEAELELLPMLPLPSCLLRLAELCELEAEAELGMEAELELYELLPLPMLPLLSCLLSLIELCDLEAEAELGLEAELELYELLSLDIPPFLSFLLPLMEPILPLILILLFLLLPFPPFPPLRERDGSSRLADMLELRIIFSLRS